MTLKIVEEVTVDEVVNGKLYMVETTDGKSGIVKADVKEEWIEKHPRVVYFIAQNDAIPIGYTITKILDVGL